jgi:hypothetical protein
MASLGRFIFNQLTFNLSYLLSEPGPIPIPAMLDKLYIPDYQVLVTDISVQEGTDIGGTLVLDVRFIKASLEVSIGLDTFNKIRYILGPRHKNRK